LPYSTTGYTGIIAVAGAPGRSRLTYLCQQLGASINDTVSFTFNPKNHTVTLSSVVNSGFLNRGLQGNNVPSFTITVNSGSSADRLGTVSLTSQHDGLGLGLMGADDKQHAPTSSSSSSKKSKGAVAAGAMYGWPSRYGQVSFATLGLLFTPPPPSPQIKCEVPSVSMSPPPLSPQTRDGGFPCGFDATNALPLIVRRRISPFPIVPAPISCDSDEKEDSLNLLSVSKTHL